METTPPKKQDFLVKGWQFAGGNDPAVKGLEIYTQKHLYLCILTRQQLLDFAADLQKAAEAMPKPS